MQITASMVKALREHTGAGMMDCKQALQEAQGNMEAAIEAMRKSGAVKAAGKAGRIAAEGVIAIRRDEGSVIILETNCETDFVAKDETFLGFVDNVIEAVAAHGPEDVETLMGVSLGDQTVEEACQQLVSKIGEKIMIRRFEKKTLSGQIGTYLHNGRIGVVVELEGGDDALARDLAMHIAASKPLCVSEDQVSPDILEREKRIFQAQAATEAEAAAEKGKPLSPEILKKMVSGRLAKFLKEVTLLGQPFVKDPDQTVGALLKSAGVSVASFLRYEVGEGIEKRADNFAKEVMAQAKSEAPENI